jgi:hypothetical protein
MKISEKFAKLIEVKSLVTLSMTGAMIYLLISGVEISKELLMLFSTSYGAIMSYFFNRKESGDAK